MHLSRGKELAKFTLLCAVTCGCRLKFSMPLRMVDRRGIFFFTIPK